MVRQLLRAYADQSVRKTMDVKDEIEGIFERELRKKDVIIEEKEKILQAQTQELEMLRETLKKLQKG